MARLERLSARVDELIFALIEERRGEANTQEEAHSPDVLALLLAARHEDGSEMSAQELRDELMTALVAGHETTASQLAWAFERLAREPAVSSRLYEELDAGSGEDYMTATINEILRHRPVLPNTGPRLVKQPVEIGGVRYPARCCTERQCLPGAPRSANLSDPYAFLPERFLEDQGGHATGTYTWIPFGGGRRRCLGASFALLEMKITLRAVLERYELTPVGALAERARRRSITISPGRGGQLVLRERQRVHASSEASVKQTSASQTSTNEGVPAIA